MPYDYHFTSQLLILQHICKCFTNVGCTHTYAELYIALTGRNDLMRKLSLFLFMACFLGSSPETTIFLKKVSFLVSSPKTNIFLKIMTLFAPLRSQRAIVWMKIV